MTTLYNTIAALQTAEGTPLNSWFNLDMLGNDWSTLGTANDLWLEEDSVPSATTPTWTAMQTIYFNFPTYSLDTTFDALEVAVALRVEAYVTAQPDCSIRLIDSTNTSNEVAVTDASYTLQSYMTLVFDSAPNGAKSITLQGSWASDPGTQTLFVRRLPTTANLAADCEVFVRITP